MILYQNFSRKFGIIMPQQLMVPRISNIRLFEFPRNSTYHYVDYDGISKGPDQTSYLFRDIAKPISLLHVTSLTSLEGNPRINPIQLLPEIRSFHAKNKRFRINLTQEMVKDESILTIVNYAFIHEKYRYTRSIFAEYYKWLNIQKTLWSEINKLSIDNERNHFVFLSIPKRLPSVSNLNLYSEKFNQTLLRVFNTNESLFFLEFWKWLNPQAGNESVLNSIEDKNLSKVNIIFTDDANWTCVNLGTILSWRDNPEDKNQKIKISPEQMQKRFLRMVLSMSQMRDATNPEDTQAGEDEVALVKDDVAVIGENPLLDDLSINTVADKYLKVLEEDSKTIEDIEGNALIEDVQSDSYSGAIVDLNKDLSSDDIIKGIADNLAEDGVISAGEYKRVSTLLEKSKMIKSPYGRDETLLQACVVTPEDINITEDTGIIDIENVTDKTMLKSSLIDFESRYINNVLQKDILGMVTNTQKAGIIITDYEIEDAKDVLGDFEFHTVKLKPVQGLASTVRFKIPKIHEDGYYKSNNNKYRMRAQRIDVPIRKISASTVALTSYYGKVFVQRSQKKVNNYQEWLTAQIMSKGLDATDDSVKDLKTGDVFLNDFICPRVYSILSQTFRSFKTGPYQFIFDRKELLDKYTKEEFKQYENKKLSSVICGFSNKGILTIDKNDTVYETSDSAMTVLGSIEDIIKLEIVKAPVDFSEVKIFGKYIPIGVVLGFEIGLASLIKLLDVKPKRVPTGTRLQLDSNEWTIVFSDETLIFNRDDKIASMVLAGFNEYHRTIRNYPAHVFDKPNVYLNVLEESSITARYLREIRLLDKLFVDPITKQLLFDMKEPTAFKALLVRSSELLLTDHHSHMMDMRYMRIRGYERVSGAVYSEMVHAIRQFESSGSKTTSKIELNPYAVWKRLTEDSSKASLDEINPIENLKQIEAVTFSGTGGRMKRAMTKPARLYLDSDMGVISEATKDSSDVAINTYMTANPQFKSLRGLTKPLDLKEKGATALVSTSALVSVGADKDDPKRTNFVSIQSGHTIACGGYRQPMIRTGYEQVMGHRTSDMFCYSAKQDGEVFSKTDKGIIILYKDGSKKGIELGRRYGSSGGLTYPNDITTVLSPGDKFKKGDIIAYNTGFFEIDHYNKKNVIWKSNLLAKTVLWESNQTIEDASSISLRLSQKLSTRTTKVKKIVVDFDKEIRNLVTVGQKIEPTTILCTIEDAMTSGSKLFDEESLNTLKMLSNQTPTAKVFGTIDKIEVFYHGEKQDMSQSLLEISNISDREMAKNHRSRGEPGFTGSVTDDFRIDGNPLMMDTLVINIYITSDVGFNSGDKGVFANQMKTVVSEIMDKDMITESGEIIDAVFGQKSIEARVVCSPAIIGTTNTILKVIAKKAVKMFKGN